MSIPADADSALDEFGYSSFIVPDERFYGLRAVSTILQNSPALLEHFTNTNLGSNPQNTNGPSALPFPVYEPKAEYPGTAAKQ